MNISTQGSRLHSNAALVLTSMCDTYTTLQNLSPSEETRMIARELWEMGTDMHIVSDHVSVKNRTDKKEISDDVKSDVFRVLGISASAASERFDIDVAQSPLATYTMLCLCSTKPGTWNITGSMTDHTQRLIQLLRQMGARIDIDPTEKTLVVEGGLLRGDTLSLADIHDDVIVPSLMMIAAVVPGGIEIELTHKPLSTQGIYIVSDMLRAFGVRPHIDISPLPDGEMRIVVPESRLVSPLQIDIEGDVPQVITQAAGYITNGECITLSNLPNLSQTRQEDVAVFELLEDMGCDIMRHISGHSVVITPPKELKSVVGEMIDVGFIPESFDAVIMLAGAIKGVTRIEGIDHVEARYPGISAKTIDQLQSQGRSVERIDHGFEIR